MTPLINACDDLTFEKVKHHIKAFELDDRQLKKEEFLCAFDRENLLAFGRLREYKDFSEICSIGVIPEMRAKGIGRQITQALIQKSNVPIFLVTIIPEFFNALGFEYCDSYPNEIKEKLNYCRCSLIVAEEYAVMKLKV